MDMLEAMGVAEMKREVDGKLDGRWGVIAGDEGRESGDYAVVVELRGAVAIQDDQIGTVEMLGEKLLVSFAYPEHDMWRRLVLEADPFGDSMEGTMYVGDGELPDGDPAALRRALEGAEIDDSRWDGLPQFERVQLIREGRLRSGALGRPRKRSLPGGR